MRFFYIIATIVSLILLLICIFKTYESDIFTYTADKFGICPEDLVAKFRI